MKMLPLTLTADERQECRLYRELAVAVEKKLELRRQFLQSQPVGTDEISHHDENTISEAFFCNSQTFSIHSTEQIEYSYAKPETSQGSTALNSEFNHLDSTLSKSTELDKYMVSSAVSQASTFGQGLDSDFSSLESEVSSATVTESFRVRSGSFTIENPSNQSEWELPVIENENWGASLDETGPRSYSLLMPSRGVAGKVPIISDLTVREVVYETISSLPAGSLHDLRSLSEVKDEGTSDDNGHVQGCHENMSDTQKKVEHHHKSNTMESNRLVNKSGESLHPKILALQLKDASCRKTAVVLPSYSTPHEDIITEPHRSRPSGEPESLTNTISILGSNLRIRSAQADIALLDCQLFKANLLDSVVDMDIRTRVEKVIGLKPMVAITDDVEEKSVEVSKDCLDVGSEEKDSVKPILRVDFPCESVGSNIQPGEPGSQRYEDGNSSERIQNPDFHAPAHAGSQKMLSSLDVQVHASTNPSSLSLPLSPDSSSTHSPVVSFTERMPAPGAQTSQAATEDTASRYASSHQSRASAEESSHTKAEPGIELVATIPHSHSAAALDTVEPIGKRREISAYPMVEPPESEPHLDVGADIAMLVPRQGDQTVPSTGGLPVPTLTHLQGIDPSNTSGQVDQSNTMKSPIGFSPIGVFPDLNHTGASTTTPTPVSELEELSIVKQRLDDPSINTAVLRSGGFTSQMLIGMPSQDVPAHYQQADLVRLMQDFQAQQEVRVKELLEQQAVEQHRLMEEFQKYEAKILNELSKQDPQAYREVLELQQSAQKELARTSGAETLEGVESLNSSRMSRNTTGSRSRSSSRVRRSLSSEFESTTTPVDHSRPSVLSADCDREERKILSKSGDSAMDKYARLARLPALVRGFLTRRFMRTQHVQDLIKTIRETSSCLVRLHQETPMRSGKPSPPDVELHKRLLQQLTSAFHTFHSAFFKTTLKERLQYIAVDRERLKSRRSPVLMIGKKVPQKTVRKIAGGRNNHRASGNPTVPSLPAHTRPVASDVPPAVPKQSAISRTQQSRSSAETKGPQITRKFLELSIEFEGTGGQHVTGRQSLSSFPRPGSKDSAESSTRNGTQRNGNLPRVRTDFSGGDLDFGLEINGFGISKGEKQSVKRSQSGQTLSSTSLASSFL